MKKLKIYKNGTRDWHLDYRLHRTGSASCELSMGGKFWYTMGELHRIQGPAIEWSNGDKLWYIEDEQYYEKIENI